MVPAGVERGPEPDVREYVLALTDDVVLLACENTMQNTRTTKADMYSGISYVSAGVTHLMKRQREGWAYIRP